MKLFWMFMFGLWIIIEVKILINFKNKLSWIYIIRMTIIIYHDLFFVKNKCKEILVHHD